MPHLFEMFEDEYNRDIRFRFNKCKAILDSTVEFYAKENFQQVDNSKDIIKKIEFKKEQVCFWGKVQSLQKRQKKEG